MALRNNWSGVVMRFRLMTYNIHKGIGGLDRRYRPERVVETIRRYEPDVVFLQEVADGVPRSRRDRQVDLLGDALGFRHRAFQRNVRLRTGSYGNAILSRYPLSGVHSIDLTIPMKKRRQALVAHCRVRSHRHARTVLLFNLHLGLAGFERTRQLQKVITSDTVRHTHKTTPVMVAGDFNDVWGRLGKRILEPVGFRPAHGRVKTFPAAMPLRPLDRIYFRGLLAVDHSFVPRTKLSRQASDHLPVVTEFKIVR